VKDPERLSEVIAAVSDGAAVDWARIESQSAPEDGQLLGQLRLLEQIALLHASLPPFPASERSADEATLGSVGNVATPAPLDDETPATWGSLTIVERIGRGTYADVYRAYDARLDRPVALKLLHRRDAAAAVGESDVIEEARLLARIRHPHVVTVHGAERIDGRVGIWMEFVDGRTLEQELHDRGPFRAEELVGIGRALCGALGAVHDAGLLHRDVKAQNVLRDRDGRVVLTDLGSGRDVARTGAALDLAGTPLYIAPEILQGHAASVGSDVYGLGVLLYHLGSGSFPVSGRSLPDISDAHARGARQPLQATRPDLPDRLASAIDQATALDVRERYESAAAFEAGLQRATAPRPFLRRLQVAVVALVLTLVAGVAGLFAWHWTETASSPWRPSAIAPSQPMRPAGQARRPSTPPVLEGVATPPGGMQRLANAGRGAPRAARIAFQPHEWVLVTTFNNQTGARQFDGTLEHAVTRELGNSLYVRLVSPERVDDDLRLMGLPLTTVVDATAGRAVALRDEDIHAVVAGAIDQIGTRYAITARVIDPQSGVVVTSRREEATDVAQVATAIHRLSDWIRATLGEPLASIQSTDGLPNAAPPSLAALRLLSDAQAAARLEHWAEAETLLTSALATDPQFAAAYMWLAVAQQNQGKLSAYQASAKRAVDVIAGAAERERARIFGVFYQMTGDYGRAVGEFDALVQRHPDDLWAIERLGVLYRFVGGSQDADDQSLRAAAARPNDVTTNVQAFQAELRTRGLAVAQPFMRRASALLTAGLAATPFPGGMRTYITGDTAHELWVQRRSQEAAAVVDRIDQLPQTDEDGDAGRRIVGWLYLTLGELRRAEQTFMRMKEPAQKAVPLATVALARDDLAGVSERLASYDGIDPVVVSLLVRAGDLPAAERQARRLLQGAPQYGKWAAAEIEEARGDRVALEGALKEGEPWLRPATVLRFDLEARMTAGPSFLFSETLSRAAANAGDNASAIHILEAAEALGDRAYPWPNHGGYFWMRSQKLLADLYREEGRLDDARIVERDLLAALAAADDDCPMLVELRTRAGK
jgi:tetratricopeptide (TPR) repeat protein